MPSRLLGQRNARLGSDLSLMIMENAETKHRQEIWQQTYDIDLKADGVHASLEAIRAVLDFIQGRRTLASFALPSLVLLAGWVAQQTPHSSLSGTTCAK